MGKKTGMAAGRDILEGPATTVRHADMLEGIFAEVQKDFKNLERASEDRTELWCPTGNAAVDMILSDLREGGGLPFGRIVEFYGNESSGKSMMSMLALKETIQRLGGVGILLDIENAFVESFYRKLGGDPNYLLIESPQNIPAVYELAIKLIQKIRSKHPDIPITVVYDSLPASLSKEEADKAMDKRDMASRAREHRKGLASVVAAIKRQKTLFIIVNQLISTMAQFGPDQDTVGGTGPKYWSSIRMHLKKSKRLYLRSSTGKIGDYTQGATDQQIVGVRGRLVVEKTRFTAPFREVQFNIFYDQGIHPYSGWFEALRDHAPEKPFIPALTQKGTPKAGYFVPIGADPQDTSAQFSSSSFLEALGKHPELLGGYPYDETFGLPREDELDAEDVDEKTGQPIQADSDDDEDVVSDPSDASQV